MNTPPEERLSAYLDDELAASERAEVERWLADDERARTLLGELRSVRDAMAGLPRHSLGEDLTPLVLRRAERQMLEAPRVSTAAPPESGWSYWIERGRRPLVYAALVVAAALIIMVSTPESETKVATHPLPQAPAAAPLRDHGSMVAGPSDDAATLHDELREPAAPLSKGGASGEGEPRSKEGDFAAEPPAREEDQSVGGQMRGGRGMGAATTPAPADSQPFDKLAPAGVPAPAQSLVQSAESIQGESAAEKIEGGGGFKLLTTDPRTAELESSLAESVVQNWIGHEAQANTHPAPSYQLFSNEGAAPPLTIVNCDITPEAAAQQVVARALSNNGFLQQSPRYVESIAPEDRAAASPDVDAATDALRTAESLDSNRINGRPMPEVGTVEVVLVQGERSQFLGLLDELDQQPENCQLSVLPPPGTAEAEARAKPLPVSEYLFRCEQAAPGQNWVETARNRRLTQNQLGQPGSNAAWIARGNTRGMVQTPPLELLAEAQGRVNQQQGQPQQAGQMAGGRNVAQAGRAEQQAPGNTAAKAPQLNAMGKAEGTAADGQSPLDVALLVLRVSRLEAPEAKKEEPPATAPQAAPAPGSP